MLLRSSAGSRDSSEFSMIKRIVDESEGYDLGGSGCRLVRRRWTKQLMEGAFEVRPRHMAARGFLRRQPTKACTHCERHHSHRVTPRHCLLHCLACTVRIQEFAVLQEIAQSCFKGERTRWSRYRIVVSVRFEPVIIVVECCIDTEV